MAYAAMATMMPSTIYLMARFTSSLKSKISPIFGYTIVCENNISTKRWVAEFYSRKIPRIKAKSIKYSRKRSQFKVTDSLRMEKGGGAGLEILRISEEP
jgi:hypothetical protein